MNRLVPPLLAALSAWSAWATAVPADPGEGEKPHWAFVPPADPARSGAAAIEGTAGAIDRFVLERLGREGLSPSPPAGPAALLRRVSLDLVGLPPDPEDCAAFLADPTDEAYEAFVDRLLASPHFGEHLAVAWLDAARYADTNGYFGDGPRQMWPWRDWVVAAFNDNMPYDRFTVEQLAGDLLPGATRSQRIATGFNRNHMANDETGIDDEEFRVEYVVDRVDATMTTWLGLTAACAQCHDHHYDPISQREFYGLFAFFNNVPEQGLVRGPHPPPSLAVPSPEQEERASRLAAETKAAEEAFAPVERVLLAEIEAREKAGRWMPPEPPGPACFHEPFDEGPASGAPGAAVAGGELAHGPGVLGSAGEFDATAHLEAEVTGFDADAAWTIGFWARPAASLGCPLSKIEAGPDRRGIEILLQKGRVQVNLVHRWGDSAIEVATAAPDDSAGRDWRHYGVAYDGSGRAAGLRVSIDGRPAPLEVRRDRLSGSVANREPLRLGRRDAGLGYYGGLDEVRVVARALDESAVREWMRGERLGGILARPGADRSDADRQFLLDEHLASHGDEAARRAAHRLGAARDAERALRASVPTMLVMEEMETPRPTHLLKRGLHDQPGERVAPHVPESIAPWPEGAPPNRLGLARWILSTENPLAARVAANRLWAHLFGEGLVRTPEDFGTQGEPPTHPELLDALAVLLRESGWDVKALLKEIAMSRTYRQSSAFVRRGGEAFDPANRLLARGPGGRLPAETLRDQALAVSGLLATRIGGPPAKPHQPPGLWEEVSYDGGESYRPDAGEGLWRRSLYTHIKRQAPPPALLNFDGPTREKCTVRRGRTNTPLQALQLLNDESHVEAARTLAGRALAERTLAGPDGGTGGHDESGVRALWRRVLLREPLESETAALGGLLSRQRERFRADPAAAAALLSVGAAPRQSGLDPVEHAAWTVVAQALLNLDETLSKP